MREKSIVIKLFLINIAIFAVFLSFVMISQTVFFEDYYIDTKIKNLKENVGKFGQEYYSKKWDSKKLNDKANEFIEKNNSYITILDKDKGIRYMMNFDMKIKTNDNKIVTIAVNNIIYDSVFQNLNLNIGDNIKVTGILIPDENTLSPLSIKGKNSMWGVERTKAISIGKTSVVGTLPAETSIINFEKKTYEGKIIELSFPQNKDIISPYKLDMFFSAIQNWMWMYSTGKIEMKNKNVVDYRYIHPANEVENIVVIYPIMENNEVKEMVFSMSSLQPVNEVIEVMKGFYIYIFIGLIAIIVILSIVYSKIIARPLIQINNTAEKMANLDFSAKCFVKSDDEIGNLSNNLNVLSQRLESSLDELKEKNEKLKEDINKKIEIENMRKEFISSISHELKTPLSIIKGYSEGIKEGASEVKREHYLNVILDEVDKMNILLLDMLELSRLESNNIQINNEVFDIDKLIKKTLNDFKHQIIEKNIEVSFDINSNSFVYADESMIEQVIRNFISNAIRYTPFDGKIIIIKKSIEKEVYIYIENKGNNIPESEIDRIWERFYRVEKSRSRNAGGTGLGLSIVKNILDLHKSKYGAVNTETGVKFFFSLKISQII